MGLTRAALEPLLRKLDAALGGHSVRTESDTHALTIHKRTWVGSGPGHSLHMARHILLNLSDDELLFGERAGGEWDTRDAPAVSRWTRSGTSPASSPGPSGP
jgi:hypothetical protein